MSEDTTASTPTTPSGLSKRRWTVAKSHIREEWVVETDDCDGRLIARTDNQEVARLIASLPNVMAERDKLRSQLSLSEQMGQAAADDNDRLRAEIQRLQGARDEEVLGLPRQEDVRKGIP